MSEPHPFPGYKAKNAAYWRRRALQAEAQLRAAAQEGWKEAAIAWEVCASIHRTWVKGKDALFSTRQADFVEHAETARGRLQVPAQPQALRIDTDRSDEAMQEGK